MQIPETFTSLAPNFDNMKPFSKRFFLDDAGVGLLATLTLTVLGKI